MDAQLWEERTEVRGDSDLDLSALVHLLSAKQPLRYSSERSGTGKCFLLGQAKQVPAPAARK